MVRYGTKNFIIYMSKHYEISVDLMQIFMDDRIYTHEDDIYMIGYKTISFRIVDCDLDVEVIQIPLSDMHTEEEFFDLILHQIKYDVLQSNNKRSMDMLFDIQHGVITDRKTKRTATMGKNDFVLCEPKIIYVQSPTLKVAFSMNLLKIYMPRKSISIKRINKKKFDNGGLWVDLHLVTFKVIGSRRSLDKCSTRITSIPQNNDGNLDTSYHETELLNEGWMNRFNIAADMFKNPLNVAIQDEFNLLEPENLYNGKNIYTDRYICTFVRIADNWIAVEWEWLINNRQQFPIDIQEELAIIESIQVIK